MTKQIQLISQDGYWLTAPLGEDRKIRRQSFESGVRIGEWLLNLRTGIAVMNLSIEGGAR